MTIHDMETIQREHMKEAAKGNPKLNPEGADVASGKRQSIDQPPLYHKIDPLR